MPTPQFRTTVAGSRCVNRVAPSRPAIVPIVARGFRRHRYLRDGTGGRSTFRKRRFSSACLPAPETEPIARPFGSFARTLGCRSRFAINPAFPNVESPRSAKCAAPRVRETSTGERSLRCRSFRRSLVRPRVVTAERTFLFRFRITEKNLLAKVCC